ncbi:hypothetical protein SAMN03159341_1328 [Paenibacillus sp. 1_12]|uniref:hypothetical protein n=1 Tax=Paenibacillus sp. 1_12 TaxID=1566278 RepID=UPI0008F336EC|nr:hypothetical protein [Paenibacillus sp. 1_12]SFM41821.1 hypothetical protein SAMN03159341_1328 [Paenibacillus sp. 1_12]
MRETSKINRPDNLLIALVFSKQTGLHVTTIVGHYSEILPDVNLLDKQQKRQKYQEDNRFINILLHNCVSKKKNFNEVYEFIRRERFEINWVTIFDQLDEILSLYTLINEHGKPIYPITASIKQDAIRVRHLLRRRRKEFDLTGTSKLNHAAPIEFGAHLRRIVS